MKELKFIIAGGGTGGHIFPAIAIANAIKKIAPGSEILFVGAKGKMEMEKVPLAGYKIEGITIAGFNRSSLIKNVSLPFKIVYSLVQVSGIINRFKPSAVIGVGGYSSFPVLRYAQFKNIPTFIHESNSFAGKSNIILGKKATRIFTAIDGMEEFFPANKISVTGNPVRNEIKHLQISKEEALKFFNLDPFKKTVLSVGGSLGAKSINEAISRNINDFNKADLQLIWQTGKQYSTEKRKAFEGRQGISVNEFITKMEYAYAASDLVISRSGAMAVAELCLVNKPVIFVPYPHAAEDHQTVNAKRLVDKNAAMMLKDSEAGDRLVPLIIELSKDDVKQKSMINAISQLGEKDADIKIVNEILSCVQ